MGGAQLHTKAIVYQYWSWGQVSKRSKFPWELSALFSCVLGYFTERVSVSCLREALRDSPGRGKWCSPDWQSQTWCQCCVWGHLATVSGYTKVSYHFCVLWTFVMGMGLRDSSEWGQHYSSGHTDQGLTMWHEGSAPLWHWCEGKRPRAANTVLKKNKVWGLTLHHFKIY